MTDKKRLSLTGNFSEIEEFNSSFYRTKIKVFAFDKNRNNSSIKQSVFENERVKKSIFNIPIVAKYSEKEDKFGNEGGLEGHNVYLTKDKYGNIQLKQDTYAIGVVDSNSNITLEDLNEGTEENPNIKTYVVVDNVFLWKRFDATQKIQEWIKDGVKPKVSMEIGNVSGGFSDDGIFEISFFEFEAIAALGSDVEPCFPLAQIESYTTQMFKDSFYEMVNELKNSLIDNGTSENSTQEGAFSIDENIHQNNQYQKEDEVVPDVKTKQQIAEQFSLTTNQLYNELYNKVCEMKYTGKNWYGEEVEYSKYYMTDFDESYVYAVDRQMNYQDVKMSYSKNGDDVAINFESASRIKWSPIDWDGGEEEVEMENFTVKILDEVKKDFDKVIGEKEEVSQKLEKQSNSLLELNEKYTALESTVAEKDTQLSTKEQELENLKEFKLQIETNERQEKVENLFEKYKKHLTKEDIDSFKEKENTFAQFEDLEREVKLFVADKVAEQVSATTTNAQAQFTSMGLTQHKQDDVTDEPKNVWDRLEQQSSK